jgi:hypothetical protein
MQSSQEIIFISTQQKLKETGSIELFKFSSVLWRIKKTFGF